MPLHKPLIIITDTSLLLNFIKVGRTDLLASYSHDFIVTDHVVEEVTDYYPEELKAFANALDNNIIVQQSLTSIDELQLFGEFLESGRLGAGECSAIACAIYGGHKLAIDDTRAIAQAEKRSPTLEVIRTQDLVILMIQEGLLTIEEADEMKLQWETECRFKLKIATFNELLK